MITLRHVEIYKTYGGDGDGFIRCATKEEKSVMDYSHWLLIKNFIRDIRVIRRGSASYWFAKDLNERLMQSCDTEETIRNIEEMPIV